MMSTLFLRCVKKSGGGVCEAVKKIFDVVEVSKNGWPGETG
jgi:hypothetical protein